MSGLNKILAAVVLYCLTSYLLNLPALPAGVLIAVTGSQISLILPQNYKTSITVYIPLTALSIIYLNIALPLIIGYTSSILVDLLSKRGCKLLYPYRNTTFTGPENYLEKDSKSDNAATTFLIILVIISLSLSLYGTEIIESVNQTSGTSKYLNNITHRDHTDNQQEHYIQYINIDPSENLNKNITTTHTDNTTTTIITQYSPPR